MNKLGTTISIKNEVRKKNEVRNWGRAKYLDNRGIIKNGKLWGR